MGVDVESRLAALGSEAREPVQGAPSDDLWARGRRRVWKRRTVSVVAALSAAAVLGSAAAVGAGLTRTEAVPVSGERPAVLPETFAYTVPEALPTLGAGEVSAVGLRQRETGHLWWVDWRTELLGVQAATGVVGVIETPGLVQQSLEDAVALSPDGGHLAYWASDDPEDADVATRVVVIDLRAGTRVEHELEGEFGVSTASELDWLDGETVLVRPSRFLSAGDSASIGEPSFWFTLATDGEVGGVADDSGWPVSNAVAGKVLTDRDPSDEGDQPDRAVVDMTNGGGQAITLPTGGGTTNLLWDGDERLARLKDSTPSTVGDDDVEVVFGRLGARAEGQPEGECPAGTNCVLPSWAGTGVKVEAWADLVGWRDGGVVVDRATHLEVVSSDGTAVELASLGPADGLVDTAEWGRGGAVQGWEFAPEVLAEAEVVDAVAPSSDPALWVVRNIPVVVAASAALLGLGWVGFAAVRRVRGARGHA